MLARYSENNKRPEFYETPGVDYPMHMVMVLTQELSATRDRLDTLELVAQGKELFSQDDIEQHEFDEPSMEQRESRRQVLLSNLFSVMTQEAAELSSKDTKKRFDEVIKDLAADYS